MPILVALTIKSDFTAVISRKRKQIPFGVVMTKKNRILSIKEKPILKFDYLSGIYIIKKSILDQSIINDKIDMNEYISKLISRKKRVSIYTHEDYWADLGTHENLEQHVI